jgi:hypothetical protein
LDIDKKIDIKKTILIYSKNFAIVIFLTFGLVISTTPPKPLFYANQNTYFIHGLASIDFGNLGNDWLAKTKDPFPVFSYLVKVLYPIGGKISFVVMYYLVLVVYFWTLFGIIINILNLTSFYSKLFVYLIIIFLYSNELTLLATKYLNFYLTSFFTDGVAGQYLIGKSFEPSIFGVFIFISLYFFIKRKIRLSIIFLIITVYFHASYLLSVLIFFTSYCVYLILHKYKNLYKIIFIFIFLMVPVIIFYMSFYLPLESTGVDAKKILYNYRIPHHANIVYWLNIESTLKYLLLVLSIFFIKNRKFKIILIIPVVLLIILSIIQLITNSIELGLLFPWRISVILMPLLSIILMYNLTFGLLENYLSANTKSYLIFPMISLIFLFSILGIKNYKIYANTHTSYITDKVFNFVRQNRQIYDQYVVPLQMENFRLETGVPVFIDFKSHPYKSEELVEWYSRVILADKIVNCDSTLNTCVISTLIKKYNVTHLLLEKYKIQENIKLFKSYLYEDDFYIILKLQDIIL